MARIAILPVWNLPRVSAEPVFAGENARFAIRLASRARPARRGLRVAGGATGIGRAISVDRDRTASAYIEAPTLGRGRLVCPRLTIGSRYPMGLFRCWSHAVPTAHVVVYPAPIDRLGCRASAPACNDGQLEQTRAGNAAFAGHRRFQTGDSRRRIDWKASARTDDLIITRHSDTRAPTRWFDYAALEALAPEARLSQLTYWVLEADRHGAAYGLSLPRRTLGPAAGAAHRRACLEALALF